MAATVNCEQQQQVPCDRKRRFSDFSAGASSLGSPSAGTSCRSSPLAGSKRQRMIPTGAIQGQNLFPAQTAAASCSGHAAANAGATSTTCPRCNAVFNPQTHATPEPSQNTTMKAQQTPEEFARAMVANEFPRDVAVVSVTAEQVQAMLARALRAREEQISNEYEALLNEKLTEQFQHFQKFNEDYISNRMRDSDFSYMI